jgi:hypothetical protein
MNNSIKYIVKTSSRKTYILHIIEAFEYKSNQYIGLFLYHDEDIFNGSPEVWPHLRHRLLFEGSIEAIKEKVTEYAEGRNEKIVFMDNYSTAA